MDRTTTSADLRNTLYGSMELSKNTWLLAIQFPDRPQPSLYPIEGGNSEDPMSKLAAAADRWAKVSGKRPSITLCYEAGYDAFWLARFLKTRGIESRIANVVGWCKSGRRTSTASRACCSPRAFAAST